MGRGNGKNNSKGKSYSMAIVHVAFKSSSKAPPAAAHAEYIARDGQYARRGGLELVESGNMPEFAEADPFAFWAAADTHERANGRTYTEIQVALPRELSKAGREELARQATRELMGERFAYTMAIHAPLAKDNIDQPHMHLMFSERAVDAATRGLAEDRFFKRNGAKKDPAWNDRNKPEEVRETWVALMNAAMEKAGIEERVDARSWAEQGREDLAALREPKLLGGEGREAIELREKVEALREERAKVPAPHLDHAAAVEQIEREAAETIAEVERQRDRELGILDKLIARARQWLAMLREQKAERAEVEKAGQAEAERRDREKQIESRAAALWSMSPRGRAEQAWRVQREQDERREVMYGEAKEQAEADLAQWKKEHPFLSLIKYNTALEENARRTAGKLAAQREESARTLAALSKSAEEKDAEWPALRARAVEDFKEIAVQLSPDHVRLLLNDHFGHDREASGAAFAQLEQRTHSLTTLDELVTIQNFKEEGFVGLLRQMDKPVLDGTLARLIREQDWRLARRRQGEIERGRPRRDRDTDRGLGE